jgi:hypothetical protein
VYLYEFGYTEKSGGNEKAIFTVKIDKFFIGK